jgi:hypothetical protein
MTVYDMRAATERYTAATVDEQTCLLDRGEIVLYLTRAETIRVASLLTREWGMGQPDAGSRRQRDRFGPATVDRCEGCQRVRGTQCSTFHSPALMWAHPQGCRCTGVQEDV